MSSYVEVMKHAERVFDLETYCIRTNGYGGLINLISTPADLSEQTQLLGKFATDLNIQPTDIIHTDIEQVVNSLELGINRYKLEIPEEHLELQSLTESVFEYVYRYFGQGWRIGIASIIDRLKSQPRSKIDLSGTPFGEFLATLDLDLTAKPKLFILHYPELDTEMPILKPDDARFDNMPISQIDRANKYMHILGLINQVHPSKFIKDNPDGHVLVNLIDPSYHWIAARNQWANLYDKLWNKIDTPSAYERDRRIMPRLSVS